VTAKVDYLRTFLGSALRHHREFPIGSKDTNKLLSDVAATQRHRTDIDGTGCYLEPFFFAEKKGRFDIWLMALRAVICLSSNDDITRRDVPVTIQVANEIGTNERTLRAIWVNGQKVA